MQWCTETAPSRAASSASGRETSTRRRSMSACSGPLPDRVSRRTCSPASASCWATVEPTGPAPVTTWTGSMGVLLVSERESGALVLTIMARATTQCKSTALIRYTCSQFVACWVDGRDLTVDLTADLTARPGPRADDARH